MRWRRSAGTMKPANHGLTGDLPRVMQGHPRAGVRSRAQSFLTGRIMSKAK